LSNMFDMACLGLSLSWVKRAVVVEVASYREGGMVGMMVKEEREGCG
jgi:hypothetical protein